MIPGHKIIELEELRIGNILSYKGQYVHVTTISIDADDEYEDTIGFCQMGSRSKETTDWNRTLADGLERVALTPALLEKCGLEKTPLPKTGAYGRRINPQYYFAIVEFADGYKLDPHWSSANIRYLHQLQNLYYSINGRELEVKL